MVLVDPDDRSSLRCYNTVCFFVLRTLGCSPCFSACGAEPGVPPWKMGTATSVDCGLLSLSANPADRYYMIVNTLYVRCLEATFLKLVFTKVPTKESRNPTVFVATSFRLAL